MGALFDRDERRILSWSGDGTLRLWNAATGAPIGAPMKHDDAVWGAQFDKDERRILSWSYDGTLKLWDVATGAPIGALMKHGGPVNGAQFDKDERRILSWSYDGTLRLWDAATGAPIAPEGSRGLCYRRVFSPGTSGGSCRGLATRRSGFGTRRRARRSARQ